VKPWDDPVFALEAFFNEHRRCGDLDGRVDDLAPSNYIVWMECSCGATLSRICQLNVTPS